MLDYLKKFNSLPPELRQQVSSQTAMAALELMEKKYRLPLAAIVMRVMVKEIALADLAAFLVKENLTAAAAAQLDKELREKIFSPLAKYLSPRQPMSVSQPPRPKTAVKPTSLPSRPKQVTAVKPASPRLASQGLASEPLVKSSGFFFSADDEAEIRELSKKIDLAERTDLSDSVIQVKLKEIIERAQINFGSADLVARFGQILKTYLRGIRNKLETKSALIKPFLSGGLSFDDDSAEKVMRLADKVLNAQPGEVIEPLGDVKIPEFLERDAPYDFSKMVGQKTPLSQAPAASKTILTSQPSLVSGQGSPGTVKPTEPEEVELELAPLTPAMVKTVTQKNIVSAPKTKPFRSVPAEKIKLAAPPTRFDSSKARPGLGEAGRTGGPVVQPQPRETDRMPIIRRRFEAENSNFSQKVKVEDVKFVPKVMSPLDELKYLDLVNFRRLDKDPLRAVEKIQGKISLLGDENYGKRLEGIRLWRSSPVNKLYLEIGQMSISENKPVDVIIEERKMKGVDYLTSVEFEAIMDLNKSLRF